MKFYTQKQMACAVILFFCAGVAAAAGWGGFFYLFAADKEAAAVSEVGTAETILVDENGLLPVAFPSLSTKGGLEDERNTMALYEKYNAAVVNISTEVMGYNWLFEAVPQEGVSGSGAIISRDGYIITNTHVVDKAYKVYVTLADGESYEGKIIGRDAENDLAVLKIDPGQKVLTMIPFGSSGALTVGQKVLAIGNPFGYDRTLTQGIISGVARPVRNGKNLIIKNMIQTDASINPGNSGGPLLNSSGELIGINTIIYSPSGGSVGIGFAVPVDTARRVLPDLIRYGKVNRGWIDVVPVQVDSRIARYARLPVSKGILVSEIPKNSTAASSGIQGGDPSRPVRYGNGYVYFGGDIITRINETQIDSFVDLFSALENTRPGETVDVTVVRQRSEVVLKVKLSERPEQLQW